MCSLSHMPSSLFKPRCAPTPSPSFPLLGGSLFRGHKQTSKLCPRCHTRPPSPSTLGHHTQVCHWLDMSRLQSYVLTVTRALLRRLLRVMVLKVIIVTHACLHCPPWVITREFAYGWTRANFKVMSSLSHAPPLHHLLWARALKIAIVTCARLCCPSWVTTCFPMAGHEQTSKLCPRCHMCPPSLSTPGHCTQSHRCHTHLPSPSTLGHHTQVFLWPDTNRLQSYVLVVTHVPLRHLPRVMALKVAVVTCAHLHTNLPMAGHEQTSKLCPRCQHVSPSPPTQVMALKVT